MGEGGPSWRPGSARPSSAPGPGTHSTTSLPYSRTTVGEEAGTATSPASASVGQYSTLYGIVTLGEIPNVYTRYISINVHVVLNVKLEYP